MKHMSLCLSLASQIGIIVITLRLQADEGAAGFLQQQVGIDKNGTSARYCAIGTVLLPVHGKHQQHLSYRENPIPHGGAQATGSC